MTRLRAALAAASALMLTAGLAAAQKPKKKPAPPEPAPTGAPKTGADGKEVEMEEDAPPADIEGTSENPDAPKLPGEETQTVAVVAPPPVRTGYPIEEVLRPITLPAVTSEVGLDVGSTFDPVNLEMGLRARYGITRQWQVGLRYLIGGVYDDDVMDASDSAAFNTGKAFGVDVTYLVFDWLAGHVTLPFYVDPFAMGMTLGAPMKFRFQDKVALVALDDFIDIRFNEFVPSLTHESENEINVGYTETNTSTARGNLHLRLGAVYQQSPQLAIKGNFVQTLEDFGDDDNPSGIELIFQYSPNAQTDVSGRIGIDALDRASSTFGLIVAAAYRI